MRTCAQPKPESPAAGPADVPRLPSPWPPYLRGEQQDGKVKCAKQSQFGSSRAGTPKPRRVDYAKRTQLPEAGHRGGVSIADFGLRIGDWGQACRLRPARANRAKQTQFGGLKMCETNPIRGSPTGVRGSIMQNKAKLGQAGASEPRRSSHVGRPHHKVERAKQTQFPMDRISQHSTMLSFHHPNPTAIVQNEPNLAGRPGPQRQKCAKRSQLAWPGPGPRRARDAKQTQFLDCGLGTDLQRDACPAACRLGPVRANCANEPNFEGLPTASAQLGVRNEANSATKCAKRTQFQMTPGGTGLLYKQTQFLPLCRSGDQRSREGDACKTKPIRRRIVRNEPNCPRRGTETVSESRAPGRIPSVPLFYHSTIPIRRRLYEQSQFPHGGDRAEASKAASATGRVDCAKQSQFASGVPAHLWRGYQGDPTLPACAGGDGGISVMGGRVLPGSGLLCHHGGCRVQKYCMGTDMGDVR